MTKPPDDIDLRWLNVVRRLQLVARTRNHASYAIITMHVLVDNEGAPRLWATPTCKVIEPKKSAGELLSILTSVLTDDGDDDDSA